MEKVEIKKKTFIYVVIASLIFLVFLYALYFGDTLQTALGEAKIILPLGSIEIKLIFTSNPWLELLFLFGCWFTLLIAGLLILRYKYKSNNYN